MIPKFRAWDVHNMEMFTNDQLIIWNGNIYANDPGKISVDKMRGWSIDEKYLMQSTGLFDKNGKEIFEGDIITEYGTDLRIVKFGKYDREEDFGRISRNIGFFLQVYYGDEIFIKELDDRKVLTIIGNVYENPELLVR